MNIKKFSLLKPDSEQLLDEVKLVTDRIFDDMCLTNIFGDDDEDAEAEFSVLCGVLRNPVTNVKALRERQLIFCDFYEYPLFLRDMYKYCAEAENYRIQFKTSVYNSLPPKKKLELYAETAVKLLTHLEGFNSLFRGKHFQSDTLHGYKVESYRDLKNEIEKLSDISSTNCSKLEVSFSNGFKLLSSMAADTSVNRIKLHYDKNKQITDTDVIAYGNNFMTQLVADDIFKSTVIHLSSLISQIHSTVLNFFKRLKGELAFFAAALKLVKLLDKRGIKLCLPEIADDIGFGIEAKGLCNITISKPVPNDFDCKDGNIAFITGLNQGGKTTFLRSVGIAQLFAQSGLFVPAVSYKCSCFKGILTHFPAEEDETLSFGKLAEELTRLRNDFPLVLDGGLVMLNESFATTTAREGAILAVDLLDALKRTNSTVLFVTHLNELEYECAASYITEYSTDGKRSYKIVKGDPIPDIHAIDMFL